MSASSTAELVARARNGDAAALGHLFERRFARSRARMRARLAGGETGDDGPADFLHGLCLEVLRELGRTDLTGDERLVHWMHAIARSTLRAAALGRVRASSRAPHAGERARRALIAVALARLPEDLRAIVRMRGEERLSFAQIASRLERSEAAVRRAYHRALVQLGRRPLTQTGAAGRN